VPFYSFLENTLKLPVSFFSDSHIEETCLAEWDNWYCKREVLEQLEAA
jgi:hypothetical protein